MRRQVQLEAVKAGGTGAGGGVLRHNILLNQVKDIQNMHLRVIHAH